MSEFTEQCAIFEWKELMIARIPALNNLFAVPNGGTRNAREGKNLRLSGVCPGYPDIALDYPAGKYHGLRIELKTNKNKLTKDKIICSKKGLLRNREGQETWIGRLNNAGYLAVVCYSADEAIKTIMNYINNK